MRRWTKRLLTLWFLLIQIQAPLVHAHSMDVPASDGVVHLTGFVASAAKMGAEAPALQALSPGDETLYTVSIAEGARESEPAPKRIATAAVPLPVPAGDSAPAHLPYPDFTPFSLTRSQPRCCAPRAPPVV